MKDGYLSACAHSIRGVAVQLRVFFIVEVGGTTEQKRGEYKNKKDMKVQAATFSPFTLSPNPIPIPIPVPA